MAMSKRGPPSSRWALQNLEILIRDRTSLRDAVSIGDVDFLRQMSEPVGIALATCVCVYTLGVRWDSILPIPPRMIPGGRRADYIGMGRPGRVLFEAKGTTGQHSVRRKLNDGQGQKRSTSRLVRPQLGLVFASWIPIDLTLFRPITFVTDPPFRDYELIWEGGPYLQGVLLGIRLARFAGLTSVEALLNREIGFILRTGDAGGSGQLRFDGRDAFGDDLQRVSTHTWLNSQFVGHSIQSPGEGSAFFGVQSIVFDALFSREGFSGFPAPQEATLSLDGATATATYSDGSLVAVSGPNAKRWILDTNQA